MSHTLPSHANPWPHNEYYIVLDIDPTRLVPDNMRLADLIAPLKYIHLPSPAIRLRADGTRFFALYF